MNIEKIINIEDCFDGSYIREFVLDNAIEQNFIVNFAKDGELFLYDKFPRPFFKINIPDECHIKGIIGNKSIKVHFDNPNEEVFNSVINKLTRKEDF